MSCVWKAPPSCLGYHILLLGYTMRVALSRTVGATDDGNLYMKLLSYDWRMSHSSYNNVCLRL